MRPVQRSSSPVVAVLRGISAIAAVLAVFTAVGIVALHLLHCFQPSLLPWTLKSAIPLILIGISFALLQFVLPRTRREILMGLMAALAFILWGTEQYVDNPAIASLIDDVVVLLFVLDLGIVIRGFFKQGARPTGR